MRKLLLLFIVAFSTNSFAQTLHPAKWSFKVEEKKDGEAELIFKVKMDEHWHIYSQFTPDGGPLPMLFTFDSSECFMLVGKTSEPTPVEEYDSLFMIKVLFLEKEAELRQKIKFKEKGCTIKGSISYQVCKDVCLAMDTTFTLIIGKGKSDKSEIPSQNKQKGSLPMNYYDGNQAEAILKIPAGNCINSSH